MPVQLLFICSRNRWRSPTAEKIFEGAPGYRVKSAGTESGARVRVTGEMIGWADVIFCMEKRHVHRLRDHFPDALSGKQLICLNIPDDYGFMDPELIEMLKAVLVEHFTVPA
jgi:predicted protein tyrosine phosphatase